MSETQSVAATPSSDEKNIALLTHLGGIILGFIPALILYLVKKDQASPWLLDHIKEALNFQISVTIAYIVCMVLTIILIGALLMPIVWIVNLIFCILAAVKSSSGEAYRYPLSIRLVS